MTGLTDAATYQRIRTTANHIVAAGPATTERWEEQSGLSPSSIAAVIAGLVAAGRHRVARLATCDLRPWLRLLSVAQQPAHHSSGRLLGQSLGAALAAVAFGRVPEHATELALSTAAAMTLVGACASAMRRA